MLLILRTGRRRHERSAFMSGMSILNTSGSPSLASPPHRVSAMALDALATIKGRTEKVKSVDDRVAVISKYILAGEKTGHARILSGYATADYCGTEWCIDPHDSEGELAAIHEYVKWNVRYMEDPLHYDTFDSADKSIELAFGDCDDIAIVSGAMFLHAGFPVRIKVIKTRGNSDFHHVYILVGTPKAAPNKWTPSDAAYYDHAGEEAPGIEAQKIYDLN